VGGAGSRSPLYHDRTRGWTLDYVFTVDSQARTIWITDAERGYGKRFIVRAEEILTACVELERAIHQFALDLIA
jgi:hypothetical protein